MSLADFFATLPAYLCNEGSAGDVADRLGELPSGEERLDVYRWLVDGDCERILLENYPAVFEALGRIHHGFLHELPRDYRAAHPATRWEVGRYGEHLAEYLEERAKTDPEIPPYAAELADFHYTKYRAAVAYRPAESSGLDVAVFVRRYNHTVPQFALAVERGEADISLPEAKPTLVIIYQATESLWPKVFYPSMGSVLALAARSGDLDGMRSQFPQISDEQIAECDAKLVEAEVLPPRAVAPE